MTLAVLAACGHGPESSRIPQAVDLSGTYDLAVVNPERGRPADGVAWVSGDDDGAVYVHLTYPAVAMQGTLKIDGRITFEGRTVGGDVLGGASAIGKVRTRDGIHRITLVVTAPAATTLVLQRPLDADLRRSGGRFRLVLDGAGRTGRDCTTTVDFTVPADAGGSPAIGTSPLIGTDAASIATFRFAAFDVAPSGRFHFEAEYVAEGGCDSAAGNGPAAQLRMDGAWPLDSPTAAARYQLVNGLRMEVSGGNVTITRLE